jgi:hypothetical protein
VWDAERPGVEPIRVGVARRLTDRTFAKKQDVGDDAGAFAFETSDGGWMAPKESARPAGSSRAAAFCLSSV